MKIEVIDLEKLVCVWLTRAESADEHLREKLNPLYAAYRDKDYLIALYRSGEHDLLAETCALLQYNRKLSAEREIQAEKAAAAAL